MAYHKSTASFGKMLLKFMCEPDPIFDMLEWLRHQMMGAEVSEKPGVKRETTQKNVQDTSVELR